jgi:hypothetical protein
VSRQPLPSYDRILNALNQYFQATTSNGMPILPTKHPEVRELRRLAEEVEHLLEVALTRRDSSDTDLKAHRKARARRLKRMAIEHLGDGHEMTTTSRTDTSRGLINASVAKSLQHRGLVEFLDTNKQAPRRLRATPKLVAQVAEEREAAQRKADERAAREEEAS